MKILNTFNQQPQNPNFGTKAKVKVKGNPYLKKSVGEIAKNGTLEDQSLLVKFINLIKSDSNINTFEMNMDVVSFTNKTVKYRYIIDGGKKEILSGLPFINPSVFRDLADNCFLKGLSWFIKDNYGEEVYNNAVKASSKYKPEYVVTSLASISKQLN